MNRIDRLNVCLLAAATLVISMTPELPDALSSGSSGDMEVARDAAANKQTFRRSILFMTFAGEELGLLGSAYFVDHPTVPLDKTIAMLNMDMVGRLNNDRVFM